MNSELQFGPVLLYFRTTVLSHSAFAIIDQLKTTNWKS